MFFGGAFLNYLLKRLHALNQLSEECQGFKQRVATLEDSLVRGWPPQLPSDRLKARVMGSVREQLSVWRTSRPWRLAAWATAAASAILVLSVWRGMDTGEPKVRIELPAGTVLRSLPSVQLIEGQP